jgi:hypothetical protein
MGKGGEFIASKQESMGPLYKLSHTADEELRKWGRLYGLDDKLTREQLLAELVDI